MIETTLTRRGLIRTGMATGLVVGAMPAWAQDDPREVVEMVMGEDDAPVTVVEYASLTCPHCASFHKQAFGKLKTNYIETGKVRFIHRDVYFDRYGLWGSMIARCGGREKFFGVIDILYNKQAEWSRQENPQNAIAAIFAIGRQAGMTDEQMTECTQDSAWAEALVAEYQKNAAADDVTGTPSFVINGEKHGNMSYESLSQILDQELGS